MRILLISANQEKLPDVVPPIGLAYISAAAQQDGHCCQIFDLNFHKDFDGPLCRTIAEFAPDLFGLSIRNIDNVAYPQAISYLPLYRQVMKILQLARPQTPVVLGGSGFSLFPEQLIQELHGDYGIVGEGENQFRSLLRTLADSKCSPGNNRLGGKISYPSAAPVDLDELTPYRQAIDVESYFQNGGSINIQSKRGCSFRCAYCNYPLLEGHRVRQRSPANVVDEIAYCYQHYQVDYFFFVDNVFNYPGEHAEAICNEIIRRGLPIRWTCYASPTGLTEKLISLFKRAGCNSLDFGSDTAAGPILEALGKSFSPEQIKAVSRWCHKYDINFCHSLLFGAPGETPQTVEQTISIINECQPTAVIAMLGIRLYHGTALLARLVAEKKIRSQQIGLAPIFYIEEQVRDYLLERLPDFCRQQSNWVVPGLKIKVNVRYFQRMRAQGIKGPIWEAMARR